MSLHEKRALEEAPGPSLEHSKQLGAGVNDSWVVARELYSYLTFDNNGHITCIELTVLILTKA